jgi:glucokinase
MTEIAIAIDIGGTKIRGAAIDRDGNMLTSNRLPTAAVNGAEHVLATIRQSISALLAEINKDTHTVIGLGISSAGVIEPTHGQVMNAADQIPGWKGIQLGSMFSREFGLPAYADNDANCALVGEAWHGKHDVKSGATLLMLTLGTGLGGAIMVDGCLQSGHHHLTGHFGLAKMWDPVSASLVTVEHLVSGTGLGNVYRQHVATPSAVSGDAVIALVSHGDKPAIVALDAWLDHLALQLHNFYWMIDPDLIIIGGGVVDSRALWWPQLVEKLNALKVVSPIAVATLGNDAGVYGAAKIVFDRTDNVA